MADSDAFDRHADRSGADGSGLASGGRGICARCVLIVASALLLVSMYLQKRIPEEPGLIPHWQAMTGYLPGGLREWARRVLSPGFVLSLFVLTYMWVIFFVILAVGACDSRRLGRHRVILWLSRLYATGLFVLVALIPLAQSPDHLRAPFWILLISSALGMAGLYLVGKSRKSGRPASSP